MKFIYLINLLLISCCCWLSGKALAYVEALAANLDSSNSNNGLGHFQPMVAILCGHGKYHNQYLNEETNKWVSDLDSRAVCTKNTLEILEYCRKVYPKKDIRNIVESNKYYRIEWCKMGQTKCKSKHYVKPYRCLEGSFQSDALLVPEHCVFDHIHNKSLCQNSQYWNHTAIISCSTRNMKLQSYAMLLPCGVGIFSGVEFVCCPHSTISSSSSIVTSSNNNNNHHGSTTNQEYWKFKKNQAQADENNNYISDNGGNNKFKKDDLYDFNGDFDDDIDDNTNNNGNGNVNNNSNVNGNDEDDTNSNGGNGDAADDDDDYYDDDDDDDTDSDVEDLPPRTLSSSSTTTTTTTTTTTETPIKYYLSHFNSQKEHQAFKDAQKALDDDHKSKVTKVMKEWSELEEHYQEMRIKDVKKADEFKKRMTNRFQKTVEALEAESSAEKRQIISMHQQRVMSIINMRKKSAMDCYTQSLDEINPKSKRIEKCLKKLLRALEKDRMHTLHHYKHLLNSFTKQALKDKQAILDHLTDLIKMANQSIQMLDRVSNIADKIKFRMIAYWHNLRGIPIEQTISHESELAIMNRYEEEVAQKQIERERQKGIEELNREQKEIEQEQQQQQKSNNNENNRKANNQEYEQEETEDDKTNSQSDENMDSNISSLSSTKSSIITTTVSTVSSISDDFWSQEDPESNEISRVAQQSRNQPLYIQSQSFHHNEPSYSIKREHYHAKMKWNGSVYLTLAFAGIALLTATIVGVVLLKKHTQTSPHSQGFIEVNQAATPEEKHVISMQINGYENPTFRYFETQEE